MSLKRWLIDIERWIEKEDKPLSIHPSKPIQKSHSKKCPPKRYYVGEPYDGVYLTPRELEISVLLVKGYRYKEIGDRLTLSPRSIEYYIQNMRLKLNCQNKKSLIAILERTEVVKQIIE